MRLAGTADTAQISRLAQTIAATMSDAARRANGFRSGSPGSIDLPDSMTDGVVTVRRWDEGDVAAIVQACQDPEIPRWTTVPSPYTEQNAREWLESMPRSHGAAQDASFAVVDALDGRLLGAVGYVRFDWDNAIGEIGYWTAAPARGRGVATRAVRLLARWGFEELHLARVELIVHVANAASQRVAANAGFTREGVLRSYLDFKGERADVVIFSLLAGELG